MEDLALLHRVQASLQNVHGPRFLVSIVRSHLGHHALKILNLFPENTAVENRCCLNVERHDLEALDTTQVQIYCSVATDDTTGFNQQFLLMN